MTTNKPMTSEQLDELMTVAVNMQREAETDCNRPSAMFAYAVQIAVLELQKVRDDSAALAAENAGLKAAKEIIRHLNVNREEANFCGIDDCYIDDAVAAMITPATDAFLAEVRAQGVDVAIEHLINKFEGTGRIGVPVMALEWLAKELRKGVQS